MVRHVHSREQCPWERLRLIGVRTAECDMFFDDGEQEALEAEWAQDLPVLLGLPWIVFASDRGRADGAVPTP